VSKVSSAVAGVGGRSLLLWISPEFDTGMISNFFIPVKRLLNTTQNPLAEASGNARSHLYLTSLMFCEKEKKNASYRGIDQNF
jgi:hypothetical protein